MNHSFENEQLNHKWQKVIGFFTQIKYSGNEMKNIKMDAERGRYGGGRREDVPTDFGWKNHHLEDLGTDGRTLVYTVYLRNHLSSSIDLSLFSDTLPA